MLSISDLQCNENNLLFQINYITKPKTPKPGTSNPGPGKSEFSSSIKYIFILQEDKALL